jgi:hypothetical protein
VGGGDDCDCGWGGGGESVCLLSEYLQAAIPAVCSREARVLTMGGMTSASNEVTNYACRLAVACSYGLESSAGLESRKV